MMTKMDAIRSAQTALPGSPEHAIACELCMIRGDDPNGFKFVGMQVANWQWIIAEKIIEEHLRHALGRGAGAQRVMVR